MGLFQFHKYLLRTYQGAKCWGTMIKVKAMRYHIIPTTVAKMKNAGKANASDRKC